jgi:hypothetical protein
MDNKRSGARCLESTGVLYSTWFAQCFLDRDPTAARDPLTRWPAAEDTFNSETGTRNGI